MKKNLLLLCVLCCYVAYAQQEEIKVVELHDIYTQKTTAHVNVPGTRLYMVPPVGFKKGVAFTGFESDNGGIQIFELTGGNYYTNAATFSREEFEAKGATVLDFAVIKVNNYPGKYLLATGQGNKMLSIVFGDSTFSVMVTGLIVGGGSHQAIEQAIKTVYYDKTLKVDPLAAALFTIDDSKSKFKFSQMAASMYMYTIGGKVEEGKDSGPMIMVMTMPLAPGGTCGQVADLFLNKLKEYNFEGQATDLKSRKVNGLEACERTAKGSMKGDKAILYQFVILNSTTAIMVEGLISDDNPAIIDDMRKLAETVRIK